MKCCDRRLVALDVDAIGAPLVPAVFSPSPRSCDYAFNSSSAATARSPGRLPASRHRRREGGVPHRRCPRASTGSGRIPCLEFASHDEAHALASLFYTDWNDALLYTADGVGDNVSYSIRTLKDGRLRCHFGDDRWLMQRGSPRSSLAWAYGFATKACGYYVGRVR